MRVRVFIIIIIILLLSVFVIQSNMNRNLKNVNVSDSDLYGSESPVEIIGYEGHAMEPFLSRDGKYLFFNNLNDAINTSLHYATKISDTSFSYQGEVVGVNGEPPHLDAVASMDVNNDFYFVSLRNYPTIFENIQKGSFVDGNVSNVKPLDADFYVKKRTWIAMDVEIDSSGQQLYFTIAHINNPPIPTEANIGVANKSNGTFLVDKNSKNIFQNINTENPEYAPSISSDGLMFSFTRFDGKDTQVLIAERNSIVEPFGEPKRIPIIGRTPEAVTFSPESKSIYYHKNNGEYYSIYRMIFNKNTLN